MIDNYLSILRDSLIKKLQLLDGIEEKSLQQAEFMKSNAVDLDTIEKNMDDKVRMIEEIDSLDDGFESLYQRIKEELNETKDNYKEIIEEIKALITKVTEKSASIQAIEARNKIQMDLYIVSQKKEIQSKRSAMTVARDYYQNMNKTKHVTPQFLDRKK